MSENAGEYNVSIRIEERTGAKDTSGQLLDEWQTVHARLWAKIKGESGMSNVRRAAEDVGVLITPVRRSVRIRYRTDIDEGMRVVVIRTGDIYDILKVLPDDVGREYTDLVCEAKGNDG